MPLKEMSFLSCCLDPELFDGLLKRCDNPHCCCGCCSALRPRYKRLVDNIFPVNPEDGLVRNNMEKLTFFALSSPEKLDRIGEYLLYKVTRDIQRHRNGYVLVAVEAFDQLLVACHAQSLNLFVESFLKMVQKLLESPNPQLQLVATQSFVKFANIEEDTPSYHRRYDFFVSKFSSLCHNNDGDRDVRRKLRLAGLRGLQGVVRKTVSDDLQVNIWERTHMDKIIPSLLFNMYSKNFGDLPDGLSEEENPNVVSELCLRELVGRATFGNIKAALQPVLKHLDNHELWVPNEFAVHTFRIVMFSIKSQYAYDVIQILLSHLDEHDRGMAKVRTGIVDCLCKIISIAASETVGPSVVGTTNSLLTHLRKSVDRHPSKPSEASNEKIFQETIINTLGEFVQSLPDYQKIEIMMFILGKIPAHSIEQDVLVQNMLLKSLLKVCTKYTTVQLTMTFQPPFLEPLMRLAISPDPDTRLSVFTILLTLIDRHGNLELLKKLERGISSDYSALMMSECSKQDLMFMKKNGADINQCVFTSLTLPNSRVENALVVFRTLGLLVVEVAHDDVIIDMVRLMLAVQEALLGMVPALGEVYVASVHGCIASFLRLVSYAMSCSPFTEYVEKVMKNRQNSAAHLLLKDSEMKDVPSEAPPQNCLFDRTAISEAFKQDSRDFTRLQLAFVPRNPSEMTVTRSASDLNSVNNEVDSVASSPNITRKNLAEDITVDSIRKMMLEPLTVSLEQEQAKRQMIVKQYQTAAFEELVAMSEAKGDYLQIKLREIFNKLSPTTSSLSGSSTRSSLRSSFERPKTTLILNNQTAASPSHNDRGDFNFLDFSGKKKSTTSLDLDGAATPTNETPYPSVYEIQFPELFVY